MSELTLPLPKKNWKKILKNWQQLAAALGRDMKKSDLCSPRSIIGIAKSKTDLRNFIFSSGMKNYRDQFLIQIHIFLKRLVTAEEENVSLLFFYSFSDFLYFW